MPPKPKYQKNQIIDAAYEMTREKGIDSVVARAVGKRLGTSSSPIFTVYSSMEEVRVDVRELAKRKFMEYMDGVTECQYSCKEFGMRWVRFAVEEPNLYRLLFLSGGTKNAAYNSFTGEFKTIYQQMMQEVKKDYDLEESAAENLLNQVVIHANGLATFYISDVGKFSEKLVDSSLNSVFVGAVITNKLQDDFLWEKDLKELVQRVVIRNEKQEKSKVRKSSKGEK
ncbi:MAG: TetR/AcrR family transcriptional regulator [Lachnospiraceae bacterium]